MLSSKWVLMAVPGSAVRNRRERQIMRRHQANRAPTNQSSHHVPRSLQTIVGVGARQQLVQQKQQRHRSIGEIGQELEPLNLRIKAGNAALQRIENADGSANRQRRQPQRRSTHRRSSLSENGVQSNGAQERALARHIRPAHNEHLRRADAFRAAKDRSLPTAFAAGSSGWTRSAGLEAGALRREGGKWIGRMLKGISGQRGKSFESANRSQPSSNRRAEAALPAFGGQRELRVVESKPEQECG